MGKLKAAKRKLDVQYVVDANGERTAVVVPIDTWRRIRQRIRPKKRSKEALAEDIRQAVQHVKEVVAGVRPPGPSLHELLDQLEQEDALFNGSRS